MTYLWVGGVDFFFCFILIFNYFFNFFSRLSNSSSFTELQFLNAAASRRAAVAAAGLPPGGPQNGVSAPTPQRPEYHPAYRIPSYMDLYSLHNATSPQLHGKFFFCFFLIFGFRW